MSTLDPAFFLLPEKRERYQPAQFVKQWKVLTVDATRMVEPVYTVGITGGGAFVIEGNILVNGPAT